MPTLSTVTTKQLLALIHSSNNLREVLWCLGCPKNKAIDPQDVKKLYSMLKVVGVKVPWCIATPFCYDNSDSIRAKRKVYVKKTKSLKLMW